MTFSFIRRGKEWETHYQVGDIKGSYLTTSRNRAITRAWTMIRKLVAGRDFTIMVLVGTQSGIKEGG